jgi:hypothetical protein
MNGFTRAALGFTLCLLGCGLILPAAAAQESPTTEAAQERGEPEMRAGSVTSDAPELSDETAVPHALTPLGMVGEEPGAAHLWPDLSSATLMWFAVLVILILMLQTSPLFSLRNLDALVLAATAILLAFRFDISPVGEDGGTTKQSLAYTLLAIVAIYWFMRGFFVLRSRRITPPPVNVSEGSMFVLIAAVLAIAFAYIATGPVSPASREGVVGGMYLVETGKLPYGSTPGYDSQSPLLYLVNAAALKFWSPFVEDAGQPLYFTWSNRSEWINGEWWTAADMAPLRLLNAVIVVLTLAPLVWIGKQLHSVAVGLALMAIYAVFPGSIECFNRTEIMLSTMLLTWSLAFALVPGIGGLLAMLFIVLAGMAWPWAWFAAPVMLCFFIRQGWNGVGATVGFLGGAALCIMGVMLLVEPSLPRYEGAVAHAGMRTTHVARMSDETGVTIEPFTPVREVPAGWSRPLWEFLLQADNVMYDQGGVLYREIDAEGPVREEVQREYRKKLAGVPDLTPFWASLRSVLESTWLPRNTVANPIEGAWKLWSYETGDEETWRTIRRGMKILAVVVTALIAFGMLRLQRPYGYKLVGAVLATLSLAYLCTNMGAVTNWAWLLPVVLAAFAAWGVSETPKPPVAAQRPVSPNVPSGTPAPRVSVNN